jgi:N,N dimethylarginine dimethylhydrolase, eukaryotic
MPRSIVYGSHRTTETAPLCNRLQVVEISRRQMDALCGNVIELEDGRGHPVLALSSQSYHAFTGECMPLILAIRRWCVTDWQGIRRFLSNRMLAEQHQSWFGFMQMISGGSCSGTWQRYIMRPSTRWSSSAAVACAARSAKCSDAHARCLVQTCCVSSHKLLVKTHVLSEGDQTAVSFVVPC